MYGGPIHSLAALVKALAAQGHDVTVVTSDGNGDARLDVPLGRPVDFHGARVIYLPRIQIAGRSYIRGLSRVLDRELSDRDVVHASSIWTHATWAATGWAQRRDAPCVVSTRGNLMRWYAGKDLKKRAALALGMRRRLGSARCLHATSLIEAEELRAAGFDRVEIVPNGIELPQALPDREESRARWSLMPSQQAVVAVGRVHPVKRLDLVIRAVARSRHEDTVLLLAGTGPEALVRELKDLAAREGLGGRCRFVGHVTGADKWSLLRAGDLFVQASSFESFGVAIGEALGMGTPALITERCSWEDIGNHHAGKRAKSEDLGAAMDEMLADPSQLRKAGEAGQRWVRSAFDWQTVARSMISLYDRAR